MALVQMGVRVDEPRPDHAVVGIVLRDGRVTPDHTGWRDGRDATARDREIGPH